MYTGRPWTMRQYAGFGTAVESNQRYHALLDAGTTGLSVAFDLPTQMGYDSDDPVASGEVGKVGVAIDSIDDMRMLFDGIPLDQVSTSMTINAPAAVLLLLYQLVAEEQGVTGAAAQRHDPERRAQGVHRPRHLHLPAGRVAAADHRHLQLLPRRDPELEHHLDLRLPHGRGRGDARAGDRVHPRGRHRVRPRGDRSRAGRRRLRAAAGVLLRRRAPRCLEEVAKFRAARRIWAQVMRDEFGAKNPKSLMLRFHTQTAGVQLTAQQPEVNLVRVAVQALGGGARRHAVAAHQLLRRGDRAADGEGGDASRCARSRSSRTRPT